MNLSRLFVPLVLCLAPVVTLAEDGITFEPKPGPGAGKQLVFLTGDEEYRSEEGLPMLAKILSQRHGFRCTVLFATDKDGTINPSNNASVPGAEALDHADGIMMLLRFRAWPDDGMKHFVDAVQRGVPIVALRTSTHAFRFPAASTSPYKSWSDKGPESFGKKILGEEWISHWGANRKGATLGVIEPGAENDPLLHGVTDVFGDSGVYEAHPTDAKILLRGQVLSGMNRSDPPASLRQRRHSDSQEQGINEPMMPVAWTRVNTGAPGTPQRVFCTTMGAATDLQSEGLRRLIVNAVYWSVGLEVPAMLDVQYVDPYTPSDYSAGGFRKGLRPANHALGKTLPPKAESTAPAAPR
jgi:hypothetical protein